MPKKNGKPTVAELKKAQNLAQSLSLVVIPNISPKPSTPKSFYLNPDERSIFSKYKEN